MKDPAQAIVPRLLAWFADSRRQLPWRGTKDPYRIWVSEIMLQQTRVEAVVPYYDGFLRAYPTIADLASAPLEDVLARWAGLGYYRRARMLHAAARLLVAEHDGRMPAEHERILALPGVGAYTAAAIASIAFDEPHAALDGNAYRVLARLADYRSDLSRASLRKPLQEIARSMIESVPPGRRGDFTQALMELGATVCVPRRPRCQSCPWIDFCAGFEAGTAPGLPAKAPERPPRHVTLTVLVLCHAGRVLLRKRPPEASVMPGFWELPAGKSPESVRRDFRLRAADLDSLGTFSHAITDTRYTCQVFGGMYSERAPRHFRWVSVAEFGAVPLATVSKKALELYPPLRDALDAAREQRMR